MSKLVIETSDIKGPCGIYVLDSADYDIEYVKSLAYDDLADYVIAMEEGDLPFVYLSGIKEYGLWFKEQPEDTEITTWELMWV